MAHAAVDNAYGATVTFGTNGWSGQITDITPPPITRDALEIVHLGSTTSTWVEGGVVHPGEMSMEVHFNPDDDPEAIVGTAIETVVIRWLDTGDAPGATYNFNGFVTGYEAGQMTTDQLMTGTIRVQVANTFNQTPDV